MVNNVSMNAGVMNPIPDTMISAGMVQDMQQGNDAISIPAVIEPVLGTSLDKEKTLSDITNANMCLKSRAFVLTGMDTTQPENYFRTAILRETVAAALCYQEKDPKNIMEYMKSRYEECGFKNFQQKRLNLLWDHRRVMRYINDESRKPIFPNSSIVEIGGQKYRVFVDFAFIDPADPKKIELVQLKIGKPEFTSRGTQNMVVRDLRLYGMIQYARQAGFKDITASFYYLRKNTDTTNWATCEQNFFGGGGNVISLHDVYEGVPNDLDQQLNSSISLLESGVEPDAVCEDDCKKCKNYDLCKYLMPPLQIQKDPIIRSASNIRLTPAQQQAVEYEKGIVRINAGAGAGKTMVVALRIKRLVEKGVLPQEICCVTFTNAGAKEMLHRAELYAGCDLSEMKICTFNSFQNDIVKDCWKELGFAREPKVIDDIDKYAIIANLLNNNPIFEWTGNSFLNFSAVGGWQKGALRIASDVFSAIKKLKMALATIDVDSVKNEASLNASDISYVALDKLIKMYDLYEAELKQKGLIEFIDQEALTFKVLSQDPDYLNAHYAFKHIIVDEFQDTSAGQIEFIKYMRAMPTFESLMIVGDDSQAIFGFRDTTPEFIIHFEQYIGEHVDDIFLLENHRSTPEIIDFANKINDLNINKVDKALVATRPHGMPVVVNGFYNKADEYKYIVTGIKAHLQAGYKPEDIAVIAYTKDELKQIADMLTKENIPSMFAAPEPLLENSRIRAILAFVQVILNRDDTKDALIVANALSGGILMDESNDTIKKQVADVVTRAEQIYQVPTLEGKKALLFQLIDEIAFNDEAVLNFKDGLNNKEFDEIVSYCLNFYTYGNETCYRRINDYPGIVLITAHSSKGLEYKVVYNTISKYQRKTGSDKLAYVEETRRLLFVSATRARDELYVSGLYGAPGSTKDHPIENRYLVEALNIVGKPYNAF